MSVTFALSDNPRARYATGSIMYFAQGIPQGLSSVAGEIEVMRDKEAAAAIDTGDASIGKESNAIDRYQCPRCNGSMVRVVDPQQRHIWYETCGSCHGSFLDAGELLDLSKLTIADFFKGFVAPERK